jgi:hypothetical protein
MLKITRLEQAGDGMVVMLEGRLVGPWVDTLRQVAREELGRHRDLAFEVSALTFVDRSGEELLRELVNQRIRLKSPSGFVKELLKANGGAR